ncbi:IS200/IS605 family transposase [Nocardia sp. CA-151230]|uniref:IS200/IS605 family transposase n=1 Tax=Nocardia sp. CA-151230 TaxID=3239982 RepID=UPI003D90D94A
MPSENEILTGRHCVFALHAHLVFITKYRHRVFTDRHLKRMEEIMQAVYADFECEPVEFNGDVDHVHLQVTSHPKSPVAGTTTAQHFSPSTASG